MKKIALTILYCTFFIAGFGQLCMLEKKLKVKYDRIKELSTTEFKTDSNFYISEGKGNSSARYGIIDKKGNDIVPALYDDRFYSSGNYVVAQNTDKGINDIWNLASKTKARLPYSETAFSIGENKLAFRSKNGLFGYCDLQGKELLAPKYKSADVFVNGRAVVTDEAGQYGVINTSGEYVIKPSYSYIGRIGKTLFSVATDFSTENEKEGLADNDGKLLLPVEYKMIADRNGLVEVQQHDSISGFFDYAGNKVADFEFRAYYSDFRNGYITLDTKGGGSVAIDTKGKKYLENVYPILLSEAIGAYINPPDEGYFIFSETRDINNALFGIVKKDGDVVVKPVYNKIGFIKPGYVEAVKYGNDGSDETQVNVISLVNGDILYSNKYDELVGIHGNHLFAEKNGKTGAIKIETGEVAIPFIYGEILELNECRISLANGTKTAEFTQQLKPVLKAPVKAVKKK